MSWVDGVSDARVYAFRQSKTLTEAVEEYKRRYKRLPPKGFDDWRVSL